MSQYLLCDGCKKELTKFPNDYTTYIIEQYGTTVRMDPFIHVCDDCQKKIIEILPYARLQTAKAKWEDDMRSEARI